jgi:hypothetical protein
MSKPHKYAPKWFSTTIEKDVNGEAQEFEIKYFVDCPEDGVQDAYCLEQNPITMRHTERGADVDLEELFKYHKEDDLVERAMDFKCSAEQAAREDYEENKAEMRRESER